MIYCMMQLLECECAEFVNISSHHSFEPLTANIDWRGWGELHFLLFAMRVQSCLSFQAIFLSCVKYTVLVGCIVILNCIIIILQAVVQCCCILCLFHVIKVIASLSAVPRVLEIKFIPTDNLLSSHTVWIFFSLSWTQSNPWMIECTIYMHLKSFWENNIAHRCVWTPDSRSVACSTCKTPADSLLSDGVHALCAVTSLPCCSYQWVWVCRAAVSRIFWKRKREFQSLKFLAGCTSEKDKKAMSSLCNLVHSSFWSFRHFLILWSKYVGHYAVAVTMCTAALAVYPATGATLSHLTGATLSHLWFSFCCCFGLVWFLSKGLLVR